LQPAKAFLTKNKALQYPLFRNYLLLRFTLILSLYMQSTIIAYYVYKLTHDKLALGMLGLWEVIPAIGVSLFSGHFVDLKEKRGLLVTCVISYLLLSVFFVALAWPGVDHVFSARSILWLIYLGIFIGGAIRAFLSPAYFALLGMLLPKEEYPNATMWSSTAWQTGAVIGPLLGGFMIASSGFHISLLSICGVQLISLVAITRIPPHPILNKEREPIMKSLGEGLRFVFSTQIILAALSLDMFAVLFGGAVALLPVYTDDILKAGELGYGWMRAAPGIGSVLTLMILSFLPITKAPGIKLMLCITGFGITTIIFGYCGYFGTAPVISLFGYGMSWGFIVAFSMLLLGGMLDAVSVVIRGTILQLYTPDNMRGRVAAVNTMFVSSSNELGAMESGLTARLMGTVPAVVFGGCMTIVVVATTWLTAPKLRTLKLQKGSEEES
jgi:MFS family permease